MEPRSTPSGSRASAGDHARRTGQPTPIPDQQFRLRRSHASGRSGSATRRPRGDTPEGVHRPPRCRAAQGRQAGAPLRRIRELPPGGRPFPPDSGCAPAGASAPTLCRTQPSNITLRRPLRREWAHQPRQPSWPGCRPFRTSSMMSAASGVNRKMRPRQPRPIRSASTSERRGSGWRAQRSRTAVGAGLPAPAAAAGPPLSTFPSSPPLCQPAAGPGRWGDARCAVPA